MMCIVFIITLLAVGCLGYPRQFKPELDEHWQNFKNTYNKSYAGVEDEMKRRLIWEEKVEGIANHNLRADMGFHSYRRGLNRYSDLSFLEILALLNGYRIINPEPESYDDATIFTPTGKSLPDQVDWRTEGYVTPVQDQGEACGACWAFTAAGALEGQQKNKTGKLVPLSEQNLLDCCQEDAGCGGGDMETAYQCVESLGGIDTAKSYPYRGQEGRCRFDSQNIGATCQGFVRIPRGDEGALKEAVASKGPIAVAINAHPESFHDYKEGIFDDPECGSTLNDLNHALLLIGYGTKNGKDYWLLKNSWGKSFGMNGYIEMSRNKNNQCGIATKASYPLL